MRASRIAVVAALFAIPSVGYAQQDGRVGADLSTSPPPLPSPSAAARAFSPPPTSGRPAGYTGMVTPGQVVPEDVQVMPRAGGLGSAFINGHRVIVDPSNRILRTID